MKTASISTWRFTWAFIRYNPWSFFVYFVCVVFVLTTQAVPGLVVRSIFDRLTGYAPVATSNQGTTVIWSLVVVLVIMEGMRMLADLGAGYEEVTFRSPVKALLQRNLLSGILRRPGAIPLPISSGEALNRFDNDVGETADFPLWIPHVVGNVSFTLVALAIMLSINTRITLIVCLPLIGIVVVAQIAWSRMLHLYKTSAESNDVVVGFLGEIFGAVQAIKVADAEQGVITHLEELNEFRRKTNLKLTMTREFIYTILKHTAALGIGIALILVSQAMRSSQFTVGDFALFVSYLTIVTQIPTFLGTFIGDYKTQAVSIQRMDELLEGSTASISGAESNALTESHPVYMDGDPPPLGYQPKADGHLLQKLESTGLSYQYPGTANGIRNINLTLERSSFTVITGRVGSGKTTLLRTLLGLLPKDGGEIRWNGENVPDPGSFFVPPRSAYTPQVPRLFSETLKDNVLTGLPEENVDLSTAIHAAVLEQDVTTLENGVDTLIGPRGVRLSGGQVQRTAAARMFVRDPELLVFDDLSSALDVETEHLLWERLTKQRVSNSVTCLVVSHRRSALQRADHIIVLKDGQVEAEGKLELLLEASEEMRSLWRAESKEEHLRDDKGGPVVNDHENAMG